MSQNTATWAYNRPRVALETTLLLHGVPPEQALPMYDELARIVTAAGAQPVARQGDLVTLDTLPVGHPVRIIFIAPGGPIVPGTPYQAMLVIDSALPMVGQISSGNPALEG